MAAIIHHPHDKLIKTTMKDVRVARDFFNAHLPTELLVQLDLSTLALQNQSFIDEQYQAYEADILYQVMLNQQEVLLYTLIEHQSHPDRLLPLRIRQYKLRILEEYRKKYPGQPFPVIYVMVVYTGQEPYNYSTDFFDLFGHHQEQAKQYWQQPTPIVDVCREPDEEIQRHRWFGIVELAFKYRQAREFEAFLDQFLPWLAELDAQDGSNLGKDVVLYVLTQFEQGQVNQLLDKAQQTLPPKLRGDVMTMADQLRETGRQEGMQQGMQQGVKVLAAKLIKSGMPVDKVAQLAELPEDVLRALAETEDTEL